MKRWVRLYTDVPNLPKVQQLSDRAFRFWINCICVAGDHGALPNLRHLAFVQHVDETTCRELLEALQEANLVDEVGHGLAMHDYDDWQYKTDGGSTLRARDHRKKRNEAFEAELNGKKPNGLAEEERQAVLPGHVQAWQVDEAYGVLVAAWAHDHPDAISSDFAKNYKHWHAMKPDQQKQAVERLNQRIERGLLTSTTLRYWLTEDYKRPVAEPRRPAKHEDKVTRVARQARERAARGGVV